MYTQGVPLDASAAPAASSATNAEVVHRPAPGIARGLWEAPSWAFFVMPAAIALLAILYAAYKVGLVHRLFRRRRPR